MERTFGSPNISRDAPARELINHLTEGEEALNLSGGVLYYDFPLFRDESDVLYRSNVLLASRNHGILIFKTEDPASRGLTDARLREIDEEATQLNSILFSKFIKSKVLRTSVREVASPIRCVIVLSGGDPARVRADGFQSDLAFSYAAVDHLIHEQELPQPLPNAQWEELRSLIEGAKGLIKPKERSVDGDEVHGKLAILAALESEIANFDTDQRRAAISIVTGPQRIRGLAGSGKTIVLAMKAAHLHLTDPTAEILVTFYTKSLYDFIKRLITRFYRQFNDKDPDWERVLVRHAWGGRKVDGVYYSACLENGVRPLPLRDVMQRTQDPFSFVCEQLLKTTKVGPRYDFVLMDEAQDFPPSFYRLCFELTRGGERDRNVVWAYDELQNIMNVRIRSPRDMFGMDRDNVPLMDLERAAEESHQARNHDIVLHRCYRNSREVLICAHALGFGIYSNTIVQMLENREHWEDVGYVVERGDCIPGEEMVVSRPLENSPLSITLREPSDEIISYYVADSFPAEVEWIGQQIRYFLREGLCPDDIMLIALDDRNARAYFQAVAENLQHNGIMSHNLLGDPYSEPAFVVEDHVTLTTVYRAKGNEAPVVLAAGIDGVFPSRREQRGRNKVFTAFTRAKAWLRVSGVGEAARFFTDEIDAALAKVPRMEFIFPDPEQIVTLQRDLSDKASRLRKLLDQIDRGIEQLELDPEDREFLFNSITKKKE